MRRRLETAAHGIEGPALHARARVEAPHDPARCFGRLVVADRRADDDHVRGDDGCGGHLVLALPVDLSHADGEIDSATPSELRARAPGCRVQRDETCVVRPREDSRRADCPLLGRRVAPEGHTAAVELIRVAAGEIDLWVIAPALGARRRVEPDHAVERRAEVERVVCQYRGGLEREVGGGVPAPTPSPVAVPVCPGHLEAGHVLARDLCERRVALAPGVLAAFMPLFFVSSVLRSILAGEGDAKTPMIVLAVSTVANIALDALFILVLGMGLRGAAVATILAVVISVTAFSVLLLRRKSAFVRLRVSALVPSREVLPLNYMGKSWQ